MPLIKAIFSGCVVGVIGMLIITVWLSSADAHLIDNSQAANPLFLSSLGIFILVNFVFWTILSRFAQSIENENSLVVLGGLVNGCVGIILGYNLSEGTAVMVFCGVASFILGVVIASNINKTGWIISSTLVSVESLIWMPFGLVGSGAFFSWILVGLFIQTKIDPLLYLGVHQRIAGDSVSGIIGILISALLLHRIIRNRKPLVMADTLATLLCGVFVGLNAGIAIGIGGIVYWLGRSVQLADELSRALGTGFGIIVAVLLFPLFIRDISQMQLPKGWRLRAVTLEALGSIDESWLLPLQNHLYVSGLLAATLMGCAVGWYYK